MWYDKNLLFHVWQLTWLETGLRLGLNGQKVFLFAPPKVTNIRQIIKKLTLVWYNHNMIFDLIVTIIHHYYCLHCNHHLHCHLVPLPLPTTFVFISIIAGHRTPPHQSPPPSTISTSFTITTSTSTTTTTDTSTFISPSIGIGRWPPPPPSYPSYSCKQFEWIRIETHLYSFICLALIEPMNEHEDINGNRVLLFP